MSRVYDAIMGLVVGDALGVPVEFQKRDSYHVTDMIGYGSHCQPPGTWSDDSSMTLATVDSLVVVPWVNPRDIMNNFALWFRDGKFTPYGEVFDIGGTTASAIRLCLMGQNPEQCGGTDIWANGNGSLMRILPLAFTGCDDRTINDISGLTHAHWISKTACRIYVHIARSLLAGERLEDVLDDVVPETTGGEFDKIGRLPEMNRDEIKSDGYVVDTLEAALWCVLHSDSYRECVLLAVNLGGDTDTVAAVAGGLAGIIYGSGGEKGIPEEWIDKIAKKDWIKSLCEKFERNYTPA